MSLTSYAPELEDVTLWRLLRHVSHGFYIDIGRPEPGAQATSLAFYEQGWKGVHIVPDLSALAVAGGNIGLARHGPTLDTLFQQLGTDTVHWMRLDARDFDVFHLAGWTTRHVRPWVVLIELNEDDAALPWEAGLLEKGYRLAGCSETSRYYVSGDCPLVENRNEPAPAQPAETPLQYLYARVQKAEQAVRDTTHRLAEAEAKLSQAEARTAQAELDALSALAEARQIAVLQHQLRDVYASTSWQVTKPMRWLSRLRRAPRAALAELGRAARAANRRLAGALTRRLIDIVRASPPLKRVAMRFPGLVRRFQGHIRQDLATISPTAQGAPAPAPASRTTVLGPRFRALILDEIQRYEDSQYQGKQ